MIDKLTPKFLDKSSDYKLVRKTSLIDASIYVDVETGGGYWWSNQAHQGKPWYFYECF